MGEGAEKIMDDYQDIYEQFKSDVSNRVVDMYYDEDDLVMVYDIAGDNGDYYIQLKALMLGYKLFPKSEELTRRLGFILASQTKNDSLVSFLEDNRDCKGFVWDMLRVRSKESISQEEVDRVLDELLEKYTFDDDEDNIQFMDLIEYLEATDWFVKNYKRIIERSVYRDTALNECARMMENVDHEIAITLLEELTREDPFNPDSWLKLAELYHDENRDDDARMALDYAKAIRPEHPFTMYLDAFLMLENNPVDMEATKILERVISLSPTFLPAKSRLTEAYVAQDRKDLAIVMWEEELRRYPDSFNARESLALLKSVTTDDNLDALFDNFDFDGDESEFVLSHRVEMLLAEDRADVALELLRSYESYKGVYDTAHQYIKLLYNYGKLTELCEFMEKERPEGCPELRLDPISLVMYAASMLRLGRYDEAAETAREYLLKAHALASTTELAIQFAGMKIVLHYIEACAQARNYSPDRDPLTEAMQ